MKVYKTISTNILKLLSLTLLFTALISDGFSQVIALPDTNFRNKLLMDYPSVMSGDSLDVAAANSFTNDLNLANANISDLTGIEHFRSVFKINANGNNLTTVPDLSPITNLQFLYLSYNKLDNIDFLLNNKNLIQLHLFGNRLTSLPALSGFSQLLQLFISDNKIAEIQDLSDLVNLHHLLMGNNPVNKLPDMSQNTNIVNIQCHMNNLTSIEQVSSLPKLEKLSCYGNKIADLSPLNSNTTLKELIISDNLIDELPDLNNKPLTKLHTQKNNLTFKDLTPLLQIPTLTDFRYETQDSVGISAKYELRKLENATISLSESILSPSNVYYWYKDSVLIETNTSGTFDIPVVDSSDAGSYNVKIANQQLPLLTLSHRPLRVEVSPCMEVMSFNYNITANSCREGATIEVQTVSEGASLPVFYTLNNKETGDSIITDSEIFRKVSPGIFNLFITDSKGCRRELENDLKIYKSFDCDPVIRPNSNTNFSTYFIEKAGIVKILDMSGRTIKELKAPAVWDGTRSDGSPADAGYYVILLNNTKLTNITVIR